MWRSLTATEEVAPVHLGRDLMEDSVEGLVVTRCTAASGEGAW